MPYPSDFAGGSQSTYPAADIEYTKGKGNKDNIIEEHNTNRYRKDKQRISPKGEVRSYWRCVVNNCHSRIVLIDGKMATTKMVKHSHASQKAEVDVNRVWQSAKERARTTTKTEQQIIAETLNSLRVASNEFTTKNKTDTLRRCIRNVRARSSNTQQL